MSRVEFSGAGELRPEDEQTAREFSAALGLDDLGPEVDARVSQAWGHGYGTGLADAGRRRRSMAEHPAGGTSARESEGRSVFALILMESAAVGVIWAVGLTLAELARATREGSR